MEMIRRKIRLFLVSYGRLILFTIGFIFIVVFTIQKLNAIVAEQNLNKYSDSEYQDEINNIKKKEEDKLYISQFIDYCNYGEIQKAYDMLSDNCKQEKFTTIKEFEEKYINRVFKIKICDYSIIIDGNAYKIKLIQDMLVTGKTNSIIETKYRIDNTTKRSIYICD